ncbi:MAG: ABC transporter permease [Phycisphaerales bacterium]|nr:ABC transporter permease [Phycisphaerales bacterium]
MGPILTLAMKDLRVLLRDKVAMFFAFGFPIIYAMFFGAIFSGAGGDKPASKMAIVVTDEDQTPESEKFAARLDGSDEFAVARAARADGESAVRGGQKTALIVIPAGFGESRRRLFYGEPPRLLVGVDPSRRAESGMITGILTKYMAEGMQEAFSDPKKMQQQARDALAQVRDEDMNPALRGLLTTFFGQLDTFMAQLPAATQAAGGNDGGGGFRGFEPVRIESMDVITVKKRIGPMNTYAVSFPQGIVWGVMGCAAGFGISLVSERAKGTLMRLKLAPIHQAQILGGKALACFLATLAVSSLLTLIAVFGFGVSPTSAWLLVVALLCVSAAFVGIMMLLSVLGRTEQAASGIGWAVLTMMAMIGGGMIPLFVMPAWMQQVSSISPIKWAILAVEGGLWRGFSPEMMLLPCGILLAIGAGCFAIGVRGFRWAASA